jgi:hypothetical protein
VEQREQRIEQQIAVREVTHVQLCGLWVLMLARSHDGVTGLSLLPRERPIVSHGLHYLNDGRTGRLRVTPIVHQ